MPPSIDRTKIRKDILRLLQNNGHKSYRPKEIARTLDYSDNKAYQVFREVLHELEVDDEIARVKGGRYTYRKRSRPLEGTISVTPRGFGFVTVEGEADDFYIRRSNIGTALDGDRVLIKLYAPSKDERSREAAVERVLERKRTKTVGTFTRYERYGFVRSDNQNIVPDIYVPASGFNDAKDGDKVVVSIDRYDDPEEQPEGRILEVIGPASSIGVEEKALALSLDVRIDFPKAVVAEAGAIPTSIDPADVDARLDLRSERIFTIDPDDAKDFDDAIHIRRLQNGNFSVGVHIADVSFYVKPNGAIGDEAFTRGTSVYLVDRVIPMLPEHLSNGVCSLRPNEDKLTYSCLMEVTPAGKVVDYRLRETVIHSQARFTYEQAQALIDDPSADHPLADDVRAAARLSEILTKKRFEKGGVDFETPEVKVVLDDENRPIRIIRKHRLLAHRLIEEFMLLANRTAARHIGSQKPPKPFVYRVHDKPDQERIKALAEYVRVFGYTLPVKNGTVQPGDLRALLAHARGTSHQVIVEQAALRSMAKAIYTPDNIGHYGLGFEFYTHFTSPIRRYPDLIVHRLLKAYAHGAEEPATPDYLASASKHCSTQERAAETAERESVKLKQVEYMQRHVGEQFKGVVSGVTSFGAFVELNDILVEGLVHVRDMDDYYEYDERRYALVASSSGRTIRPGDDVEVIVAAANPQTRQIDFVFAP